jgi:hypothetical protein
MKIIRSVLLALSCGAPALLGCGETILGSGVGAGGSGQPSSSSSGCAAPALLCAGNCVTPGTDAANCGSCGHDCQGGACQSAMCQPVTLASGLPGSGVRPPRSPPAWAVPPASL